MMRLHEDALAGLRAREAAILQAMAAMQAVAGQLLPPGAAAAAADAGDSCAAC
jgi:hypothetical protein